MRIGPPPQFYLATEKKDSESHLNILEINEIRKNNLSAINILEKNYLDEEKT